MGNVIVGIILLIIVLNAARMVYTQNKRMREQKCPGNCDICQIPCQAKRIYHRNGSGPSK